MARPLRVGFPGAFYHIINRGGHLQAVEGVEEVVGVPEGVDVSEGPVHDPRRRLEGSDEAGRIEESCAPEEDAGVPGGRLEPWGPADLEVEACLDEDVGLA
ncbi:hypothetical protein, partial [Desulfosarcina sp.]|uniref:hypothetical protein n=1 Tax=Desulfosarcina sp. TaxID=2027861 RepID=UPI00397071EF